MTARVATSSERAKPFKSTILYWTGHSCGNALVKYESTETMLITFPDPSFKIFNSGVCRSVCVINKAQLLT